MFAYQTDYKLILRNDAANCVQQQQHVEQWQSQMHNYSNDHKLQEQL